MNHHSSRATACLFPLALASSLSAATSITLHPVADAFVSAANPTGNFGGGGALGISAAGLPKGELQALMMFDFSAARTQLDAAYGAGGWLVDSLSLQLTASTAGNPVFNTSAGGNMAVRWFDDDSWTEGSGTPAGPAVPGVNFNSLAALFASGTEAVGSFAFGGGTSGITAVTLTSLGGLQADILAGRTASLDFHATDATASGVFNSRSFTTAANRPVLTLTASAVPETSTGLLALLAITVPALRRRR